MDGQLVIQAISSIGFPIVMCLLMFKQMDKQDSNHKEEISKITEAVNNNTIALNQLINKLEGR